MCKFFTIFARFFETMKLFYILLGSIAVVLATIGIFVPGLPTTPLVLLASWCFYRSSPRLRAWLLQSFLGKYIREYISTIFFIDALAIRIIVWVAGLIGCIVVGFVVPKAKE